DMNPTVSSEYLKKLTEEICRKCVFYVIPVMEPTGTERGWIRFNGNGYDVNRRWNEVDLTSENSRALRPECWYVKRKILELNAENPITLLVNLHNDTVTDYMDAVGTETYHDAFWNFERALTATGVYDPLPKKPCKIIPSVDSEVPTTFSLWWDDGIPMVMIEQKVSKNRTLNSFPSVTDSQTRGAWLAVLIEKFFGKF
ncbi:MAG: hypothetical protein Q4C70_15640, partial [Planctomycetia bacterium]|nr:hypothetical protein [Planctomycetia bacterium]